MKRTMLVACVLALAALAAGADEKKGPDWVKVTSDAGWQPSDSQGEVVFRDQLWLFGGWFNSFAPPPPFSSWGICWRVPG